MSGSATIPRVVVLCPPFLPVPAVRGGGREILVTALIRENEAHGLLDMEVLSPWDEEAEASSVSLSKSHVSFLTPTGATDYRRIWWKPMRALQRYVRGDVILNSFYRDAHRLCRSMSFDVLVDEGGIHPDLRAFSATFGRERVGAHLHCVTRPKKELSGIVGFTMSVSDYVRRTWNPDGRQGTRDSVVHNGVDVGAFSHPRRGDGGSLLEHRRALGFGDEDFIVLYCGRIAPEKGPLELARAVLAIEDRSVKLAMVGGRDPFSDTDRSGRYHAQLEQVARGSDGRIRMLGYIDNDRLGEIYRMCSLQVVPTLCEEAAGLAAVEGMAAGLPLIVTDSGGLPEYVDPTCAVTVARGASLVSELSSAILALREDDAARASMSAHATRRARGFTHESFYLEFVRAVAERCDELRTGGSGRGTAE